MAGPDDAPHKQIVDGFRWAFSDPLFRVGAIALLVMGVVAGALGIYHELTPSALPPNATVGQAWATLPDWERAVVIVASGASVMGVGLMAVGGARLVRNAKNES